MGRIFGFDQILSFIKIMKQGDSLRVNQWNIWSHGSLQRCRYHEKNSYRVFAGFSQSAFHLAYGPRIAYRRVYVYLNHAFSSFFTEIVEANTPLPTSSMKAGSIEEFVSIYSI
jgi:hypothetical protein